MAMEIEPDMALLESLHYRQVEQSTTTENAVALHQSDKVHRKEPQNYAQLEAFVTDFLQVQEQDAFCISNGTTRSQKRQSNPSRCFDAMVTERKEVAGSGYPRAGVHEALHVHFKQDDQNRGNGNGDKRKRTPSPPITSTVFSKTRSQ